MEIKSYLNPTDLEEAYRILTDGKKNQIIAGGAWLKLSLKQADTLISLDKLGLDLIEEKAGNIEIGSMVTLREVETNELVRETYDGILAESISHIMGMNIRNQATLGGSVMGRFAFSDIIPSLLVMNTSLVFHKAGEISLEDFLKNPRMGKDILVKILIKKEKGKGYFRKVARTALDFSIVNIAVSKLKKEYKIAVGSRPQIAELALNAMNFLNSSDQIDEEKIENASQMAIEELSFSYNNRSSKEYREHVAKVYIERGLMKVTGNES